MVRAQVPVAAGPIHTQASFAFLHRHPAVGLTVTQLDGIAITRSGQIAIIELKTTQQSRAQHKQTYKTPCTNLRVLHRTGALNNEYNAHQWQCGYGMVAFKGWFIPSRPNPGVAYSPLSPETYPDFAGHDIIG